MAGSGGGVLVIGSVNMDMVLRVRALPAAGETVLAQDAILRGGGKGANQAVAAALAGAPVRLAGCVGDDANGARVRETLERAGVGLGLLQEATASTTGLAVVLVAADGENAIAVSPGANHALTPGDVEALRPEVRRADVVLMQMELPVEVVLRAADVAADVATRVVLNLAPATQVPASLLAMVDVLVVNRTEAAHLLGDAPAGRDGLLRAAEELRSRGPAAVVITDGAEGAVVADGASTTHRPAARADEVVDTSGAGDAFVGVLAAGLSRGAGLLEAVGPALAAGAVAVGVQGPQLTGLPDLERPPDHELA